MKNPVDPSRSSEKEGLRATAAAPGDETGDRRIGSEGSPARMHESDCGYRATGFWNPSRRQSFGEQISEIAVSTVRTEQ
jgi:hypothetical protein